MEKVEEERSRGGTGDRTVQSSGAEGSSPGDVQGGLPQGHRHVT